MHIHGNSKAVNAANFYSAAQGEIWSLAKAEERTIQANAAGLRLTYHRFGFNLRTIG